MENKFNLTNIKKTVITCQMVANRNCENFIGATQVPLGLAGPIKILQKEYYLPLATTEGALVASVNRGCKATRLSGGITTFVDNVGITRAPLFKVKNLEQGRRLIDFVKQEFAKIGQVACVNEPFLSLLKCDPFQVGTNVWLRFSFDTREAMGMNMVTVACQKIADFIWEKLQIKCLALSGNLCIDKKPAWLNLILGRGKKVWAESVIQKQVVKEILKTEPLKMVEIIQQKAHLGSMISGSMGFNSHFANIVAALFLATGQDMAHVTESSLGIVEAELQDGDLHFSVYLPDMIVGTIGGGTGLPTQKEALMILGLDKLHKGDSLILAQIVAAATLAGELSLIAALASGHLARAHQVLGRG